MFGLIATFIYPTIWYCIVTQVLDHILDVMIRGILNRVSPNLQVRDFLRNDFLDKLHEDSWLQRL